MSIQIPFDMTDCNWHFEQNYRLSTSPYVTVFFIISLKFILSLLVMVNTADNIKMALLIRYKNRPFFIPLYLSYYKITTENDEFISTEHVSVHRMTIK